MIEFKDWLKDPDLYGGLDLLDRGEISAGKLAEKMGLSCSDLYYVRSMIADLREKADGKNKDVARLLARCYVAMNRSGWEKGPTDSVMIDEIVCWFDNTFGFEDGKVGVDRIQEIMERDTNNH